MNEKKYIDKIILLENTIQLNSYPQILIDLIQEAYESFVSKEEFTSDELGAFCYKIATLSAVYDQKRESYSILRILIETCQILLHLKEFNPITKQ